MLGTSEPTPENVANAVRKLLRRPRRRGPEALRGDHDGRSPARRRRTWRAPGSSDLARGSGPNCRRRPAASRSTATSTPSAADDPGMPATPPRGGRRRRQAGQGRRHAGPRGAAHSAEIQYAMGNLRSRHALRLGAADHKVSEVDAGVLRELHQDRQSERSGPAGMADVQRATTLPAHAHRRGILTPSRNRTATDISRWMRPRAGRKTADIPRQQVQSLDRVPVSDNQPCLSETRSWLSWSS